MFLHVIDAKYLSGYRIELKFNDERVGVVDLEDALEGEMFESLRNLDAFAQLKVDAALETIVWPNGADLAPEYLYFKAFKHDERLQPKFKKWGYI